MPNVSAFEAPGAYQLPFEAGADLSALQFTWVKLNTTGQIVACTALTDRPIGILQDKPTSGQTGTVMMAGVSFLKAAAALANTGTNLGTDTSGRGKALTVGTDTTQYMPGTNLSTSGAANELIACCFDCRGAGRAA